MKRQCDSFCSAQGDTDIEQAPPIINESVGSAAFLHSANQIFKYAIFGAASLQLLDDSLLK